MQRKHWYAAYTKYKYEENFVRHIERKGFTTYLPRKRDDTPLFERYVFVQTNESQLYQCANTIGLIKLVRFSGYPSVIPDAQIEFLKIIESNFQETYVTDNKLLKGDRVLIIEGPLSGYEAILTEDQGNKRVALEVAKLNQAVLIEIPLNHIEPLERQAQG